MTVENTKPIQHFIANGTTKAFAINFAVEGKDNIKVTVNDTVVSVDDYSYDALINSVVFNTAPVNSVEITIERVTSLERSITYQTYDNSFRPEILNYDLDRIWHVLQEMGALNDIFNNNVKDLNEYVDSLNDETKAQFLAEIQKQGVSMQQLDMYVSGLYQKLANTAVEKGWLAEFVADGTENQKVINDKTTQYVPYFSSLLDLSARNNGQVVIVRAYNSTFKMHGGGRVIFVENDTLTPNSVTIFQGVGGNWHRIDWKEPSIFDAGIDGTNDAKSKFQVLLEEASKFGLSVNLKKKTLILDKLDLVDDSHIYNGTLDFTGSTESSRYGRSSIMSKKTDRNLSIDFERFEYYKDIEELEDIRFVNVTIKSNEMVGNLYKFKTLKFINCNFHWQNGDMFKFIGGWHGTPLINDTTVSYNLIDPINGRCSDIELTNCNWFGGYVTGGVSFPIHFIACEDIRINGGSVDSPSGYRIDMYNKKVRINNMDYVNTNEQIVLDTIAGTAHKDLLGMYIGQNTYDIEVNGGKYIDFANKCFYVEASSQIKILNVKAKCNNPNSVAKFIDLQPNFRNNENTHWGNISDVEILNNTCEGVLQGIITTPYNAVRSLKNLDIKNNTINTRSVLQAIVLIGLDTYSVLDNNCKGSLFLGSNNASGSVRNNSFYSESNYALYVNDVGYGDYPDFDNNSFQVGSGSIIYNNSRTGYGKLRGGRLISYDRSSIMQKGATPGNINAEDFDFGGEKQFSYTQNLNLAESGKVIFYIVNPLYKAGWSSSINLQNIDELYSAGISLTFMSTVKSGSIAVLVENKGVAVNQDFNLIVNLKPTMNLDFTN